MCAIVQFKSRPGPWTHLSAQALARVPATGFRMLRRRWEPHVCNRQAGVGVSWSSVTNIYIYIYIYVRMYIYIHIYIYIYLCVRASAPTCLSACPSGRRWLSCKGQQDRHTSLAHPGISASGRQRARPLPEKHPALLGPLLRPLLGRFVRVLADLYEAYRGLSRLWGDYTIRAV